MTHPAQTWIAPDLAAFEAMAEASRSALPPAFLSAALAVAIRIEDFASDGMLRELDLDDPFDLTGLYDGVPLTEKATMAQPQSPDTIWLFRRPILDEWAHRGNEPLGRLIAHVYIHELAHHFGWSDDDIAAIDHWWD